MKLLFLLLLIPTAASAQSVTPNFTTGTMTQTVVMTQTVNETSSIERFGGKVTTWNGENVKAVDANGADTNIIDTSTQFTVIDATIPWQLEIVDRAAGIVETEDITRTVTTNTTTNTLSVFAQ